MSGALTLVTGVWLWVGAIMVVTTTDAQWRRFVIDLSRMGYSPLLIWLIAIGGFLSWPYWFAIGLFQRSKR